MSRRLSGAFLDSNMFQASSSDGKKPLAGFTLIELMVSMGIIILVSTIGLTRHAQFNETVRLRNLTYDIALSVREAQSYGINVREFKPDNTFDIAYGIHLAADSPTEYVLFADRNDNGVYDGDMDCGSPECVERFRLQGGYSLDFCGLSGGSRECAGAIDRLAIMFKRPSPDAIVRSDLGEYGSAQIAVRSPKGAERFVSVYATGQVSVEAERSV